VSDLFRIDCGTKKKQADSMSTIENLEKTEHLPKLFYTIKDAAAMMSMSEKSVRRLLERGLLKSSPALRIKLITRDSIEAFAEMV